MKKIGKLVAVLLALSIVALVPSPAAAQGIVSVSGTQLMVTGNNTIIQLMGVDDSTALIYALQAYVNDRPENWGKNMNFPEPDIGQLKVTNLSQMWYAYFWFCAYYNLSLVRIGASDAWATEIMYRAWHDDPVNYYAVLDEMCDQADSRGVYIELVLAGSQEWPLYSFGANDSVLDLNRTVGHAYHNYLDYVNGTVQHLSPQNAILAFDVWNEPDHIKVAKSYWGSDQLKFKRWASNLSADIRPMTFHLVDMGVGGTPGYSLWGWDYGSFLNSTGDTGFSLCHRHYYASAQDDYLLDAPHGWSERVGKPLIWGELANNFRYPLERWPFAEHKISANEDTYCTMVLRGTYNYPYAGNYPVGEQTKPPSERDNNTSTAPPVPGPGPIRGVNGTFVVVSTNTTHEDSVSSPAPSPPWGLMIIIVMIAALLVLAIAVSRRR